MNRQDALSYMKRNALSHFTKANNNTVVCPICKSGTGTNKTGAAYRETEDGYKFSCYSHRCYINASVIDIIALEYGMDPEDKSQLPKIIDKAAELFNINLDDNTQQVIHNTQPKEQHKKPTQWDMLQAPQGLSEKYKDKGMEQEEDLTNYFLQANKDLNKAFPDGYRGISLKTLNKHYVGYVEAWKHPLSDNAPSSKRIIIPTSKYSYLARAIEDNKVNSQFRKQKAFKQRIFNLKSLKTAAKPVFIVEGEIDAMSIEECNGVAIGLGSVSMINSFLEAVKEAKPKVQFVCMLDADGVGQSQQQDLVKGLRTLGIPCCEAKLNQYNKGNKCKDANELLQVNREALSSLVNAYERGAVVEQVAEPTEETKPLTTTEDGKIKAVEQINIDDIIAYNCFGDYRKQIEKSKTEPCYKTGFKELDRVLGDGLYNGLYVIGAISSLGKTTFTLQVADNLAKQGHDVLIFSLEMSRNELISKSISRLTYINNMDNTDLCRSARGVLNGREYDKYSKEQLQAITDAESSYNEYSKHIAIVEGNSDIGTAEIRRYLQAFKEQRGKAPIVILDYLQILKSPNDRFTDKQAADRNVTDLKVLTRDFQIPLIAISSVNRENYSKSASMSMYKESGGVEFSSDVCIALEYQYMKYVDTNSDPTTENGKAKDIKVYESERKKQQVNGEKVPILLQVLKNRMGVQDTVALSFISRYNYFEESSIKDYEVNITGVTDNTTDSVLDDEIDI